MYWIQGGNLHNSTGFCHWSAARDSQPNSMKVSFGPGFCGGSAGRSRGKPTDGCWSEPDVWHRRREAIGGLHQCVLDGLKSADPDCWLFAGGVGIQGLGTQAATLGWTKLSCHSCHLLRSCNHCLESHSCHSIRSILLRFPLVFVSTLSLFPILSCVFGFPWFCRACAEMPREKVVSKFSSQVVCPGKFAKPAIWSFCTS